MFRLPHPPLQTGAVLNRYSNNRDPLTDEGGTRLTFEWSRPLTDKYGAKQIQTTEPFFTDGRGAKLTDVQRGHTLLYRRARGK